MIRGIAPLLTTDIILVYSHQKERRDVAVLVVPRLVVSKAARNALQGTLNQKQSELVIDFNMVHIYVHVRLSVRVCVGAQNGRQEIKGGTATRLYEPCLARQRIQRTGKHIRSPQPASYCSNSIRTSKISLFTSNKMRAIAEGTLLIPLPPHLSYPTCPYTTRPKIFALIFFLFNFFFINSS